MKHSTIILSCAFLLLLLMSESAAAQPRIVAHRGGRYEADENTIPAFASALKAGITGYELDIHRSADGKYVIMHDSSVSRTVNAEGILEKMPLSSIRSLRTMQGNRIPTLDEVLALFGQHDGLYVEFEMKTTDEKLYPEELLAIYAEDVYAAVTKACPAGSTYILSSFDTRVLRYLKEHHPDARLMLITAQGNTEEVRAVASAIGLSRIACYRTRTTQEQMRKAHEEGFVINLWPNADSADVAFSCALGADYVCTDRPRQLCGHIDKGHFNIKK